jgi:hypothetical protein
LEHETPLFGKVLLGAGVLSVVALLSIVCSVLVRWLGGSFGFFIVGLCFAKNFKSTIKFVGFMLASKV